MDGIWRREGGGWIPLAVERRTSGVEIPPTSLFNATSVLPSPACQQQRKIQREPCLRETDSCVKLLSACVYGMALSNRHQRGLSLKEIGGQVRITAVLK